MGIVEVAGWIAFLGSAGAIGYGFWVAFRRFQRWRRLTPFQRRSEEDRQRRVAEENEMHVW